MRLASERAYRGAMPPVKPLKFAMGGAAAVAALLALTSTSSASNATRLRPAVFVVGETEDQPLGLDYGSAAVYEQMASHKLGAIRMSVSYDPSEPTTVQQRDQLERAVTTADLRGLRVLLSVAPGHSADVTRDPSGVRKFAA